MQSKLSDREKQVLMLLAMGNSQKEIADRLTLSHYTVDVHLKNIKEKTGLHKGTELTAFWYIHKYHLPTFDLPQRLRNIIAGALLALSLYSFSVNHADFIRVRTSRAPVRTIRTARRSSRKKDYKYKLSA